MNLIKVIGKIGETGICQEDELMLLLPDFPDLLGGELIFRVKWEELIRELKSLNEIEFFIKGLHLVELKYIEVTENEFGFGSPSSSFRILKILEKKEFDLAQELIEWIKKNGGNYHIKANPIINKKKRTIFTNELNVEEGDVFHINLRVSPSSVSGSKAVNEILSTLKSHFLEREDCFKEISEKYSIDKDRIYWLRNAREVWENKTKRLITSNFYKIQEVKLNHKLIFGKYKGLTLNQVIISTKNFDMIHWATSNIEWFYFDYDAIFIEGLSIKQIIEKYGDKKTNARFSQVLEFYEIKSTIHSYWMDIKQDNDEANEERQIHENWLKDIRNDWMDNADDYWNID
jgi:hypothetical protein